MSNPEVFRESLASVPARYLASLPGILFFFVVFFFVGNDSGVTRVIFWLNVAALVFALVAPWFEYFTHRFEMNESELRVFQGLIEKEERIVLLDALSAVEYESPWNYRLFGLWKVTMKQGGAEELDVVLSALPYQRMMWIRDVLGQSPQLALSGKCEEYKNSKPTGNTTLFVARTPDIFMMALSYGQIFILGVGALFTIQGFAEDLSLDEHAVRLQEASSLTLVLLAVFIVVSGSALSVMRFYRYTARRVSDGQALEISYGLFSRKERLVSERHLIGLAIRQNPLEGLLGMGRLTAFTKDSSKSLESNLLVPPVRIEVLEKLIRSAFPRFLESDPHALASLQGKRYSSFVALFGVALAGFLVWATAGYRVDDWRVRSLLALLILPLVLWLTRAATTRMNVSRKDRILGVSFVGLSRTRMLLHVDAVATLTIHHLVGTPFRFVSSIGVYTGRPSRFFTLVPNRDTVEALENCAHLMYGNKTIRNIHD